MNDTWQTIPATEIRVGDRVRTASGAELTVSRIDTFFGRADLLKLVESTDERWLAQGVPTSMQVEVQRSA